MKRHVRWKHDRKLFGIVLTAGAEVSEVKWINGDVRCIVNEQLEDADEDSGRNRQRNVGGKKKANDKKRDHEPIRNSAAAKKRESWKAQRKRISFSVTRSQRKGCNGLACQLTLLH